MKLTNDLNDMFLESLENKEQTPEKIEEYENLLRKKVLKVVCFFILTLIALIILIAQPPIFAFLGASFAIFVSIIELITNIIGIFDFFKRKDE